MEGMTADSSASDQLTARLDGVLARLDDAAERSGRDGREITLLLATKTRTPQEIATAIEC